jgi:hypothetical protein
LVIILALIFVLGGSPGRLRAVISEASFGADGQLYQRDARVIVSSPYIDSNTNRTVTITGIWPKAAGCPVSFGPAVLIQSTDASPYFGALEVPPWDPPGDHLTGDFKPPLVFHKKGGLSVWYSWEFTIPGFCRLQVMGYTVSYSIKGQGSGSTYLPQLTVFTPTNKSIWGKKP